MPKIVPISAKKMFKILRRLGFELARVTGKTTTVPLHTREDLSVGLLREILKDIELSVEEYEKVRK
ncbi:MAG: type II toxin-antitoxin system HicA family toxin [bacterium]|nr:type II toxin-antitoxin system HicA family toxin [bacterium]